MLKRRERIRRKRRIRLDYEKRYEVAFLLYFKQYTPAVLAALFNISRPYITKIKKEFIGTEDVWLHKRQPEQFTLFLQRGTQSTPRKK